MQTHPLKGAIFEGMVITELLKNRTNAGLDINLFYWRDKTGHEVDLIIDNGKTLLPIEIKSGMTISKDYFKNIDYWTNLSGSKKAFILYTGAQHQKRSDGTEIMNWRALNSLGE